MKRLILLLSSILITTLGSSLLPAEDTTKEPAPTMPLVGRAPNVAAWKISYYYKTATTPSRETTVYKAGDRRREIIPSGNGGSEENFYTHGVRFYQKPGFAPNDVYIQPSGGNGDTDFPELSWIKMTNYVGVKRDNGRKYYVFAMMRDVPPDHSTTTSSLYPPKPAKEAMVEVWIDMETKLPMKVDDKNYHRTYEFFKSTPADAEPSPAIRRRVQNMMST